MVTGSLFLAVSMAVATATTPALHTTTVDNPQPRGIMESVSRVSSLPQPSQQTARQQEMSDAIDRKHSGKVKMIAGGIVAALGIWGGMAWPTECPDDFYDSPTATCNQRTGASKAMFVVGLAGGGVFAWGLVDYSAANGTINRLSGPGPIGGGQIASISLSQHQSVVVGSERRGGKVSYRLRW